MFSSLSSDQMEVFQVFLRTSRRVRRSIPSAFAHRTCCRVCTSCSETGMLLGEGFAPGTLPIGPSEARI